MATEQQRGGLRTMSFISAKDAERISAAITDAERKTSGEIVAVVAEQSSRYQHVPFMWAALLALDRPLAAHSFHLDEGAMDLSHPASRLPRASGARVASAACAWRSSRSRSRMPMPGAGRPSNFSPRTCTRRRAVRACCFLFPSPSNASRSSPTAASTPASPKGTWQKIVDDFTREIGAGRAVDGFVQAIERIGAHLAEHFPPGSIDPNELPDHLIVLRN